jgi:hypothetical protein
MELKFSPKIFDFDTMLNYQLSQKFKLIKIDKFNHLIITLAARMYQIKFECSNPSSIQLSWVSPNMQYSARFDLTTILATSNKIKSTSTFQKAN